MITAKINTWYFAIETCSSINSISSGILLLKVAELLLSSIYFAIETCSSVSFSNSETCSFVIALCHFDDVHFILVF